MIPANVTITADAEELKRRRLSLTTGKTYPVRRHAVGAYVIDHDNSSVSCGISVLYLLKNGLAEEAAIGPTYPSVDCQTPSRGGR